MTFTKKNLGQALLIHLQTPGPLLLYDLSGIRARMIVLEQLSSRYNCHFLMACKSFPHQLVLDLAYKHLSGFDVSNRNEYAILPEKLQNKTVWLTDPIFHPVHLEEFSRKKNRLIITIETLGQLESLNTRERPLSYSIRLNSSELLGKREENLSRFSTQSFGQRFGVSIKELKTLQRLVKSSRHRFMGFHIHHASERNESEDYYRMAQKALNLAEKLDLPIEVLGLGGGLHSLQLDQLEPLLQRLRLKIPPSVEIFFEPGRFLSQDHGLAFGQVQLIKGKNYILDLSSLCHLQWSNPHLLNLNSTDANSTLMQARFFGPSCYENDLIGDFQIGVKKSRKHASAFVLGQTITFKNISGYSYALNRGFNGIAPAQIRFLD